MHEDPVTKSKRVTNSAGAIVSTIELDPWGADTNRSSNGAFQPKKFTSYERDGNGSDEAMFRRYNRWQSRFDQPDPSDGSYDLGDPQSFNRYAYVQGDPVNFVDPTGLWSTLTGVMWLPDGGFMPMYAPDGGMSPGDSGFGPGYGGFGGNYSMAGGTGSDPIRYLWGYESNLEGGSRSTLLWFALPQNPAPSLTDAIAAARDALKDPNSDCAKLFSKSNGLDLLNQKGKIKVKDTSVPKNLSLTGKLSGNPLVGAVTKGNNIYINPSARTTLGTHAPISNGVYKDSSGLFNGFSPVDVLAAIIIHEELHKSGDLETETGQFAKEESMANSSNVVNTCFKKSGP